MYTLHSVILVFTLHGRTYLNHSNNELWTKSEHTHVAIVKLWLKLLTKVNKGVMNYLKVGQRFLGGVKKFVSSIEREAMTFI